MDANGKVGGALFYLGEKFRLCACSHTFSLIEFRSEQVAVGMHINRFILYEKRNCTFS